MNYGLVVILTTIVKCAKYEEKTSCSFYEV